MKKIKRTKWIFPFSHIKSIAGLVIILTSIIFVVSGCSSTEGLYRIIDASKNIYIVDMNAKTSTKESPVSFELDAGTYKVTVIGVSEGGAYEAWSYRRPWKKWINKYSFSSSEFPEVNLFDSLIYKSPSLALAHAIGSKFTLRNKAKVNFYLNDSPYFDNKGGISVRVACISDPN